MTDTSIEFNKVKSPKVGKPGLGTYFREGLLVIILWIAIVTLTPFTPVGQDLVAVETQGNVVRQTLLISTLILMIPLYLNRQITKPRLLFSISFVVLMSLTLVSSVWAIDSIVSIRRSVAMVVYSLGILCGFAQLPLNRSLRLVAIFLSIVIAVDLVSVFLIPEATHPMSEMDAELRGNWRGMHNHKNIAASIASFSIFMSLYQFRISKSGARAYYFTVMVMSAVFLWGTHSKTSLALTIFGVVIYFLSALFFAKISKAERIVLFVGIILCGSVAVLFAMPVIYDFLADPRALTGRAQIWQILADYALQHPLTGSGFGSFWQIGYKSPAISYSRDWAGVSAPHGHNGYLDITAALGFPGIALSIWVFLIVPIWRVVAMPMDTELRALATAILFFSVLYNLFESSFMAPVDMIWSLYLIGYSVVLRARSISRGAG